MNNAVGGTSDQLWSSPAALDSCKHLKKPWEWPTNYTSSMLWNSLVVPLSRHVIKGFVWCESPASSATPFPIHSFLLRCWPGHHSDHLSMAPVRADQGESNSAVSQTPEPRGKVNCTARSTARPRSKLSAGRPRTQSQMGALIYAHFQR
jgi:hypothetical protein